MEQLLYKVRKQQLNDLIGRNNEKLLITTLNVHSFNTSKKDITYYNALLNSDILLPDGVGIVMALRFLYGINLKKIAGYDLLTYEMKNLEMMHGKCFFLGSTEMVLDLIRQKAENDYPNIRVKTFSPPYKKQFDYEDNPLMINAINSFSPDVLFIGMTAPKQEKWAAEHFDYLNVRHICCVGAAFDFFAGTVKRSPEWMIRINFEWLYRFIKEPKRLWRRYIIGNFLFVSWVIKEKNRILNKNAGSV